MAPKKKFEDKEPLLDSDVHKLCATGNMDLLKNMLNKENEPAGLNDIDALLGGTPLIYGCRGGKDDIVDFLISQGADLEVEDINKQRALHHAVSFIKEECMNILLRNEATAQIEDINGNTPIG
jgi:ankyrin repeat protein